MQLSDELVSQFVKTTNDGKQVSVETTAYGTIVVYGEATYVQLDGSDILTPIVSTTDVNDGDRVLVRLKNHTAMVTDNISDPSIGVKRANGLESKITQTAAEIRLEVADSVAGLESSIVQNATSITSIVSNQNEFSKFQQTVEGFEFMNKGGSVKIGGGNIDLTGCITFSDLGTEVSSKFTAVELASTAAMSTATEAKNNVSNAITEAGKAMTRADAAADVAAQAYLLAQDLELPSYLKETYIDQTIVMSPVIVGGQFYAMGQQAWTSMSSNGLSVYTQGKETPKIQLINDDTLIHLILGAGTYTTSNVTYEGRFFITKKPGTTVLTYYSGTDSGLSANLVFSDDGSIVARRILPNGTTSAVTILEPIS